MKIDSQIERHLVTISYIKLNYFSLLHRIINLLNIYIQLYIKELIKLLVRLLLM